MNSEDLDGLLNLLCEAPEDQLCGSIVKRIKSVIGKSPEDTSDELKRILDDCTNYSLASGFTMVTLNIARDMALKENKQHE